MRKFTNEEAKDIVETYVEAVDKQAAVMDLAEKYERPKKSIVTKLVYEKVYEKPVYKTKAGKDPVTKKEMIHKLSVKLGGDAELLQGLEKCPKPDLTYLLELNGIHV